MEALIWLVNEKLYIHYWSNQLYVDKKQYSILSGTVALFSYQSHGVAKEKV